MGGGVWWCWGGGGDDVLCEVRSHKVKQTTQQTNQATTPHTHAPLAVARDREQREVFPALVADQGLVEAALALEDVDGGVEHAVLEAEQEVEVAQADVGVEEGDLFFLCCACCVCV